MHTVVIPQHFGQIELIPDFFRLHYITNRGMAFGMELGGEYGKLALTSFRLVAMFVIAWYLHKLHNTGSHKVLLYCMAAILAGAVGNLIDSVFYGVWLDNAPHNSTTPWLHGQVIDMFYFYGFDGTWPEWLPFWGGEYHTTPIFNFADACIFCGVVTILIFQNKLLPHPEEEKSKEVSNVVE